MQLPGCPMFPGLVCIPEASTIPAGPLQGAPGGKQRRCCGPQRGLLGPLARPASTCGTGQHVVRSQPKPASTCGTGQHVVPEEASWGPLQGQPAVVRSQQKPASKQTRCCGPQRGLLGPLARGPRRQTWKVLWPPKRPLGAPCKASQHLWNRTTCGQKPAEASQHLWSRTTCGQKLNKHRPI